MPLHVGGCGRPWEAVRGRVTGSSGARRTWRTWSCAGAAEEQLRVNQRGPASVPGRRLVQASFLIKDIRTVKCTFVINILQHV